MKIDMKKDLKRTERESYIYKDRNEETDRKETEGETERERE